MLALPGIDAGVVIVGDLLDTLVERFIRELVNRNQRVVGKEIERRGQVFIEERQPMLDTGRTGAGADLLIDRVALHGAERLHETGAEARYALFVQQDLADRRESDIRHLPRRSLGFRVEGTDRFQRIAKEIQPHRFGCARREYIDHAAAHGIVARLHHRRRACIAIDLEMLLERLDIDTGTRLDLDAGSAKHVARRTALSHCIHRGDDKCGPARFPGSQPRQRRRPARRDPGRWRYPVIGLTVPSRQSENIHARSEQLDGSHKGRSP